MTARAAAAPPLDLDGLDGVLVSHRSVDEPAVASGVALAAATALPPVPKAPAATGRAVNVAPKANAPTAKPVQLPKSSAPVMRAPSAAEIAPKPVPEPVALPADALEPVAAPSSGVPWAAVALAAVALLVVVGGLGVVVAGGGLAWVAGTRAEPVAVVAAEPAVTEPVAPPVPAEPVVAEPVAPPVAVEPVVAEPVAPPVAAEPVVAATVTPPVVADPVKQPSVTPPPPAGSTWTLTFGYASGVPTSAQAPAWVARCARVEVVGHTCDRGPVDVNAALSLARAQAVRDLLVADGISSDRIVTRGVGAAQPVGDNETSEGRRANRRVTVTCSGT